MTTAEERIVLTRWSPLMALAVLAVTATLAVGPLLTLLSGTGTRVEQALMGVLTAFFAIPFLWTLWRVPKTLRGMGIVIDDEGIHPFDGRRADTIAWSEIAAVGFGSYSGTYRGMQTRTLSALEIYLTHEDYAAGRRRIRGDWHQVKPPAKGYSSGCFRYTVTPYGNDADRVEKAVCRYRPQLWSGPFVHQKPVPSRLAPRSDGGIDQGR
jgi:hypothetical protein